MCLESPHLCGRVDDRGKFAHELQNVVLHCGNITIMPTRSAIHENQRFSNHGASQFMCNAQLIFKICPAAQTTEYRKKDDNSTVQNLSYAVDRTCGQDDLAGSLTILQFVCVNIPHGYG